ncbi:hypothetical protein CLOM_g7624 [Closterium sp. NIES-68]|nr:hypothetical protein CLOM_g7624 [Closterium sp. NIES-68]GJP65828.1 hypothetical protein CLOP_g22742 [Closterium sp. NIES-67]
MATEFSQRAGPTEPYVVMGIEYCVPHETVLVLKENIFSLHGRAEIRDTEGQLFFMSENKMVSLHSRKTVYNAKDQPVFTQSSSLLSLHDTTFLTAGESTDLNDALVTAKKELLSFAEALNVFLKGNVSRNPDIIVEGKFFYHDYTITTSSGLLLAEATLNLARTQVMNAQEYGVRIKPNVDMALIIGLVGMVHTIFFKTKDKNTIRLRL